MCKYQQKTTIYNLNLLEKYLIFTKKRDWISIKKSNVDNKYKPGIYNLLKEALKSKKNNLKDLKYSHKLMKLIRKIYFD